VRVKFFMSGKVENMSYTMVNDFSNKTYCLSNSRYKTLVLFDTYGPLGCKTVY